MVQVVNKIYGDEKIQEDSKHWSQYLAVISGK